jgi:UDP-2-acetamido-3-amino-2,3-dideoxy-glucuronate N-acetyltransferase
MSQPDAQSTTAPRPTGSLTTLDTPTASLNGVLLGEGVYLGKFINLYGCQIGPGTKIGAFVEIQKEVSIGALCKVSSHTFVCSGVSIGDRCFVGHGVMFINDKTPRATRPDGSLETEVDWASRYVETVVEADVSIGSNATIMGGICIGRGAVIGAGAVVTRNVPAGEVWAGNPARRLCPA